MVVGAPGIPTNYTVDSVTSCSGGSGSSSAPAVQSVVNGGSFQSGIASGTWVTILGTNLASTARIWQLSDFINGVGLPISLDNVSVTINGQPAYAYYISSTPLNVLSPDDSAVGPVVVKVTTPAGSSTFTATTQATAPASFEYPQRSGRHAIGQDGVTFALLARAGLLGAGVTTRPATSGEIIVAYATGLGPTNPPYPVGQAFSGAFNTAVLLSVTIGGLPATVQFAGLIYPGEDQCRGAQSAEWGDAQVQITAGGILSASQVFIPIQN